MANVDGRNGLRPWFLPQYIARAESWESEGASREIRLLKNPDGRWTARDIQVGVSAQGEARASALSNLDAVVRAVEDDGGHEPSDKEIRGLGVEPETARNQDGELPDVLK